MASKSANGARQRAVKVGPIDTVGGVLTELGRLYRQARRGEVDTVDASRLASILTEIRRALESREIEDRLAALERAKAEASGAFWSRQ